MDQKPGFYTVDHYDVNRSAVDDLAMTVSEATSRKERILLQVGGDSCSWQVRDHIKQNYLVMEVAFEGNHKNRDRSLSGEFPSDKRLPSPLRP